MLIVFVMGYYIKLKYNHSVAISCPQRNDARTHVQYTLQYFVCLFPRKIHS